MNISIANGSPLEVDEGATPIEVAKKLNLTGPDQAVTVKVNGTLTDFDTPLKAGDKLEFFSFEDPIGKEVFWHTSAHVLAQAIFGFTPMPNRPSALLLNMDSTTILPTSIISDKDFDAIEKEMVKIVKENYKTKREQFSSKEEALSRFQGNPFKKEIIEQIDDGKDCQVIGKGSFLIFAAAPT